MALGRGYGGRGWEGGEEMGEGGGVRGEVWRRVWTGSRIFEKVGRGGFKAAGRRGRGRDIRLKCKVVVQVLGHSGIAKGKGGFGEDFRWMVLGGEEKGGGVVDFVVGREVGEWGGGEEKNHKSGTIWFSSCLLPHCNNNIRKEKFINENKTTPRFSCNV